MSRRWSSQGDAMNLGFIESKTYDEILVGDTARTEHVLTTDDAMAFASISGFDSVLNSAELIERAGGVPPTGPNMWCASLVSGLFSMNIPGPGCTLTNISLSFHKRIRVGDRILVQVQVTSKDDATKTIYFDCEAKNGAGVPIFSGTARLLAPETKSRWSTLPVPQLIVNNPYRRYNGLIARATSKPAVKTAIVWPCDEVSLGGAIQAFKDKLIVPVLVGPEATIRSLAATLELDISAIQIVDVAHSRTAAFQAVEMARKSEVQMLMKGALHTDELMGAVVSRDGGLRTGRRISHVFALDVPSYHKTLYVTDAARLPEPLSMARWHSITPFPAMPRGSRRSSRRLRETRIFSWSPILRQETFSSSSCNTWPERWRQEWWWERRCPLSSRAVPTENWRAWQAAPSECFWPSRRLSGNRTRAVVPWRIMPMSREAMA